MKFITSPQVLETEFKRLIRQYDKFLWATAWAGIGSKPFDALHAATTKIRRVVVGLHFYQTHPDFIAAFLNHKGVRFIKQAEGTFHPKVYLFLDNDGAWELIVGSGNFTSAAFETNTEAAILISDTDANAGSALKSALAVVNRAWQEAGRFTTDELDGYRTTWKLHRAKVNSLSGQYGGSAQKPAKPLFTVPVATMTWQAFMKAVRKDRNRAGGMNSRLEVLRRSRHWFETKGRFRDMSTDERQFIAGLPNGLNTIELRGDWFGSMRGSGVFSSRVASNDANISRALDYIPLNGELTRAHFDDFVREYRKTFTGSWVATATRLLAIKRPDTFVCFNTRNRKELCKAFGITQVGMDYERYWDEIIERIRDSEWWKNPEPKGATEEAVSEARAAFLDSLYYEDE